MATEVKVKTRCPVCAARYYVAGGAVGHRANCGKCGATFRVQEAQPPGFHPPTEEDIVRWLNEGRDDDDLPAANRLPIPIYLAQ